jgi:hypothetical protein
MPLDISNALRSKSVITVTGNTATAINLSTLSTNTAVETITSASIGLVASSTDGWWRIYRGDNTSGTLILELEGNNYLPFTQIDIAVSNSSTSNIYVTNSGAGGTLVLQVSKTATFSKNLDLI